MRRSVRDGGVALITAGLAVGLAACGGAPMTMRWALATADTYQARGSARFVETSPAVRGPNQATFTQTVSAIERVQVVAAGNPATLAITPSHVQYQAAGATTLADDPSWATAWESAPAQVAVGRHGQVRSRGLRRWAPVAAVRSEDTWWLQPSGTGWIWPVWPAQTAAATLQRAGTTWQAVTPSAIPDVPGTWQWHYRSVGLGSYRGHSAWEIQGTARGHLQWQYTGAPQGLVPVPVAYSGQGQGSEHVVWWVDPVTGWVLGARVQGTFTETLRWAPPPRTSTPFQPAVYHIQGQYQWTLALATP